MAIIKKQETSNSSKMEKEEKAVMLNPFCDEGFKRIFGDKILLMDFLNSFVDTEASIVDLTYENKELVSEENDRRSIIFDLFCKLDNGKHVIIEMQNAWQKFYSNRSLMYTGRAISRNVKRGDRKFDIPRVISFNIMGFNMPEFKGRGRYFWRVQLKDNDNEIFSDRLELYFVELTSGSNGSICLHISIRCQRMTTCLWGRRIRCF